MGRQRSLTQMLGVSAPSAPSAPLAPTNPSVKAGCNNATTNSTATAAAALAAVDAATKTTQDQQIALLALVVVVSIFAFLLAFACMMIHRNPTSSETQAQEQRGDTSSVGGSVRGLTNFLFPRSTPPDRGLDPALIKVLPQEIYTSNEGSLRHRMPAGLAIGIPVTPSAVLLTPRGQTPACNDGETSIRRSDSQRSMLTFGSLDHIPAVTDQLPAQGEPPLEAGTVLIAETGPVGPTGSSRRATAFRLECPVCLGEYREGDLIKWLPDCQHPFHATCIDLWLRSHSTCPLCRVPVGPALVRLAAKPAA